MGGWSRRYRAGATQPVSRRVCLSRRTQAGLTAYFSATAWVPAPESQSDNTRARKSIEYARIVRPCDVDNTKIADQSSGR